jgi:hypothetical protein
MLLQVAQPLRHRKRIEMKTAGLWMRWKEGSASLASLLICTSAARAERINQEGRILGLAPLVTTPTLFNTPQADAVVSSMQIFPVTSSNPRRLSRCMLSTIT